MAKIAVENSLHNIKEALQKNGHEVVPAEENNIKNCDCCVISGQDKNVMGMADAVTKASVVNAEGMNEQQVVEAVNQRIGVRQ
jgi:hypothetical protein